MQTEYNPEKIPSNPTLFTAPSYTEKLQTKLSLGYQLILKKIAKTAVYTFNSDYFKQVNRDCDIKIIHIQCLIAKQNLPVNLRKYLIATTTNLPSLKTYSEGHIEEKSRKYFEKFKAKIISDTKTHRSNVWNSKEVDRIDSAIERVGRVILHKSQSECLEGVCHAMISRVAKDLLNTTDENATISKYVDQYAKGVDVKTAALQLFCDAQGSGSWNELEAVDSLLGLAALSLEPDQFDTSHSGVFHIAIPTGFNLKHSMLLHINSDTSTAQLLDPNIGVFQIPTSDLKDFLKNHFSYHVKMLSGKNATAELLSALFADDKAKFFTQCKGAIEVRQLEKATQHRWDIVSGNDRYEAIWQSFKDVRETLLNL